MKFMIVRIDDERSSEICKSIEEYAQNEGGLEFPFTLGKHAYDKTTLEKAMQATGNYYTHVFHENCRSHLVPISENSSLLFPGKTLDEVDKMMLTQGALSEVATANLVESEEVSSPNLMVFLQNKFKIKAKQFLSFVFKRGK